MEEIENKEVAVEEVKTEEVTAKSQSEKEKNIFKYNEDVARTIVSCALVIALLWAVVIVANRPRNHEGVFSVLKDMFTNERIIEDSQYPDFLDYNKEDALKIFGWDKKSRNKKNK